MSNQYLSFDVTKQSTPQQLITGRQGDSQLKFVSVLLWDGEKNLPYDLTGKQVAFEALKPDGTHIVDYEGITILDAPNGLFRYSFNQQVFTAPGTMQQAFFKITHTDKDDQVIADSSLEININILENRVEFGINSTDYLSEYADLIAKVKQKFDDYAATVQDSLDKAQKIHDEIIAYTNLINENGVIKATDFGVIDQLKPIGDTAVDKINHEFTRDSVNVEWYGAVGDGHTDDTEAIIKAYDFAVAKNISVYVPSGTYFVKFNPVPDAKLFYGNGIIVNDGKQFNISSGKNFNDSRKLQNPIALTRYTYGRFNTATGLSVNANTDDEAAVVGIGNDSVGLSKYDNRDSVGLFTTNTSSGWHLDTKGLDFGIDYVDVPNVVDLTPVRIGMFIDTDEKPKNTGIITKINGNRIMVNKWVTAGSDDTAVTPANDSGIIINPTTAIWGQNTVVQLNSDTPSMAAVGYEMDLINYQPHRTNVDGITIISDGDYPANAALTARKTRKGLWNYSLLSKDSEYGVYHTGGSVGVKVQDTQFTGYSANNTPVVLSSQNDPKSILLRATDNDGSLLFNMFNDGTLSRLILARQLASGNVDAPVIFATGDITLPFPEKYPNQIVMITNTTPNSIKINARISFQGKVYNPMTLHPYSSAIFVCDGVEYYNTNFANALSPE